MSNNLFASLGEKKEKQKQKVEGGLQWNSFWEQKLVHVCHWQLEEKLRGRSRWILGFSCNFRFANLILSWYQHVVGRTMQPEPAGNRVSYSASVFLIQTRLMPVISLQDTSVNLWNLARQLEPGGSNVRLRFCLVTGTSHLIFRAPPPKHP